MSCAAWGVCPTVPRRVKLKNLCITGDTHGTERVNCLMQPRVRHLHNYFFYRVYRGEFIVSGMSLPGNELFFLDVELEVFIYIYTYIIKHAIFLFKFTPYIWCRSASLGIQYSYRFAVYFLWNWLSKKGYYSAVST